MKLCSAKSKFKPESRFPQPEDLIGPRKGYQGIRKADRMHSPLLVGSLGFFAALYAFGYFILFRSWKGKNRFEAASCGISMVHGTLTCILSIYDMSVNPWKLDAPNTRLENSIMEYYTGHGGLSAISLIAVGEATSPFQNVWTISRMARAMSPLANKIYTSMSPGFTLYFTFMRCIVGPYLTWKLASFYLSGKADAVIPRGLAYFWMTVVILAIFGSTIWVYKLWTGLIRFYARRASPLEKVGTQKVD